MRDNYKFEICANSVESCIAAQEGGADRVELCAGIPEGGTTPSYGEIKTARRVLTTTRLHVIIRPRGGDFLYSPLELERMAADIDIARELGADGVVFGCLRPDGSLDTEANAMLMEHAKGLSVTFHRAFDRCADPRKALEELISQGFDRILTSGQQPTALEGTPLLKELHEQFRQCRIRYLPRRKVCVPRWSGFGCRPVGQAAETPPAEPAPGRAESPVARPRRQDRAKR